MRALEEGYPQVAELFLEIGGSEALHALNHLRTAGEIKSTIENLRDVVELERREMDDMYPRMIRDAENEGRQDAVASFSLAQAREKEHLDKFQAALDRLTSMRPTQIAAVSAQQFAQPITYSPGETPAQADAEPAFAEVEREQERIEGLTRIREVVFGSQDALLTTVGLIASVVGAGQDNPVIILVGLANAAAGAISMSAGSYLSSKAEREVHEAEIAREAQEFEEHPAEEIAEMAAILRHEGMPSAEADRFVERLVSDRTLFLRTMVQKELGLNPDLPANPIKNALAMGSAYFGGAFVPILPFLLGLSGSIALYTSVILTGAALFAVGAIKGRLVTKSAMRSGMEILIIGAVGAIVGYAIGTLVPSLFGIEMSS
jgi:VIT1/CCC1 family predicted Fe2+/Mn2+ transporter